MERFPPRCTLQRVLGDAVPLPERTKSRKREQLENKAMKLHCKDRHEPTLTETMLWLRAQPGCVTASITTPNLD